MKPDPLLKLVAKECRVPVSHIQGPERWEEYNRARRIYVYAARHLFGDSWDQISAELHRANHSTSFKAYKRLLKTRHRHEPELTNILERCSI